MKNVLSLFSGCGGMDLGIEGNFFCHKRSVNEIIHPDWIQSYNGDRVLLQPTFFNTVFTNDIRPDAMVAWNTFFSTRKDIDGIYHLNSIVDLVKYERAGHPIFPKNIDVVTGGFPCNDFSVSGKRLGFDSYKSHTGKNLNPEEPTAENRGHLYMWMRDVITIVQPKLFIAENVKGLTNLKDVKEIIEHDFAEAGNGGYLVVPARVLNSADYGVPQSRERVIFFGFKKQALTEEALKELSKDVISSEYDPYPTPTHGDNLCPYVTCGEILKDLNEPDEATDPSQKIYSKAKYMGKHCQGQKEINLGSVGPTIRAEHHGNIEYRRLSEEHSGTHMEELKKGLLERRLTIRECARIQTFPDEYQFILDNNNRYGKLSGSDAYKIIGNAVPCLLAYNIARHIEENWIKYFGE